MNMKTMFGKNTRTVKKKTKKEEVEIEEGIADGLKGAIKAVKKGMIRRKNFSEQVRPLINDRHKQDKYGPV